MNLLSKLLFANGRNNLFLPFLSNPTRVDTWFFTDLEQQGICKVVYVDSNQLRSEKFVVEGKVDLHLANRRWLKHPDKVIASIPIVQ
jgi:hypothetical protein